MLCKVVERLLLSSQRSLGLLSQSVPLAGLVPVLCAGHEKPGGRVPAATARGLPLYPLRADEELLGTRPCQEASFPGDPGTAPALPLQPTAPAASGRL